MNSRCAFSHAATLVLAILCVVALPTDASPQGTPRLVQSASLVKLGTFTLPAGLPGDGFEFGGTALSINPANNSLFVVGHDWHQLMAEVTIPPLGGTAVVLQALHDPSEGRSVGAGDTKIGGSLVYQGQLWFTRYIYYDGDASQTMSHFSRPLSLSTSGQLTGPQTIGTLGAGFVSGYLGRIPVEWQSALGGTVLTGNCCLSIISRTSYGPAVSAWTPGQSSAVPLVVLHRRPPDAGYRTVLRVSIPILMARRASRASRFRKALTRCSSSDARASDPTATVRPPNAATRATITGVSMRIRTTSTSGHTTRTTSRP